MAFKYTLQKVLEIREQERIDANAEYTESVRHFEKAATQLYELLKKKEDIENQARQLVTTGISISNLQQTENQLLRLQQEINEYQRTTQLARDMMNRKQDNLLTVSIELKKYEKLKERKYEDFQMEQKSLDIQHMDEISIQLFARR